MAQDVEKEEDKRCAKVGIRVAPSELLRGFGLQTGAAVCCQIAFVYR